MLSGIQRNSYELLGTKIAHFEMLHMFSLHDRALSVWHGLMMRRQWSMGLVWQLVSRLIV